MIHTRAAIWTDGQEVALLVGTPAHGARWHTSQTVTYVIDLGPAAQHVRRGVEQMMETTQ